MANGETRKANGRMDNMISVCLNGMPFAFAKTA